MISRKIVALFVSCLGGGIYLSFGVMMYFAQTGSSPVIYIPLLIAGAVVIMGTIIGVIRIRIGGVIILSSIPLSIIIATTLIGLSSLTSILGNLLVSIWGLFSSIITIIGGVICLLSNKGNEVKAPKETQN